MSKGFSINDILGSTKTNAPAGQKMQVVMLPAADIEPNPENSIYEIGDVSMLKADIAERGLRSPLEVLPARTGKYMLLAGHRRWTACRALTAEGVAGFEVLPCVIRQSQGEDDDLIALITSNATARELTDGERLRQYRALKQALERKKAAGALDGRIRDEMSRITGDGTGTLGRLNAIANNCVPEVLAMVERGEITMTRAYECSKLYKVQQVEYAKIKYASMPPITDMARRAAIKYLVECGLADQLKKLDYIEASHGGTDTEDDDALSERVFLAPSVFSCAGPADAYVYYAKAWRNDVADVKIDSPEPCEVDIYFLLGDDGRLPTSTELKEMQAYFADEDKVKRPLTDKVVCKAPAEIGYGIDLTYYIASSDRNNVAAIQEAVSAAVASYKAWQRKLGRDINPTELIAAVRGAGAKRVRLTAPADTVVSTAAIARCDSETVNYGGLEDD